MPTTLFRLLPAILTIAFSASVGATDYPTKPIRLIVPYGAGGASDQLARAIQQPMSQVLGQPVIIENKPGAGGSIGVDTTARAAPDGYTVVFGNSGPNATASLMRKLPYDPLKDFRPVSTVAFTPLALVVTANTPAHSFKEFLEYARKRGGDMNYGSVGIGSLSHLTGEYFNEVAGTKMVHIPYNGGSALMTAMLGGELEAAWVNPMDGTPMTATGKIRYVGIATLKSSSVLPDVPTIAAELPGFQSSAWFGVLAPKGTPDDVVAKLHAAVASAVADPKVRQTLAGRKVEARSTTPEEFAKIIRDELTLWEPVIRKADIKM